MHGIIISVSTVVLSVVCGITYRMGGSGKYPRYLRPIGVVVCSLILLALLGYLHWTLILTAGLLYGSSTTYFKKSGTDAKWFNWLFVGLAFSCSILPIVLVYHNWIGFSLRTVTCTALIIIWSQLNGNAVWEEGGRGIIPIITLPLLLVGS